MHGPRSIRAAVAVALAAAFTGCIDPPTGEPPASLTCFEPAVDRSRWVEIAEPTFTYKLPSYYQREQGTSRWVWGRVQIDVQVLGPGDLPANDPIPLGSYSECRGTIGGRAVFIQLGTTNFASRFGTGWYTSATWQGVPIDNLGGRGTILIEAWTPVDTLIEELISVFFTLSFRS